MSRFTIKQPGAFVQNISMQPASIEGVSTSIAAFLGETQIGPTAPKLVASWSDYQKLFGGYFGEGKYLPYAVEGFFGNGGHRCYVCRIINGDYVSAVSQLEALDDVSIVYAPNAQAVAGLTDLLISHCERKGSRFAIFDSQKGQDAYRVSKPRQSAFAALYYPWIYVKDSGTGKICLVPPGGHVAGIYARVDSEFGVYHAPANQLVKGATDLEFALSASQQDSLNLQAVNCIRNFAGRGILVWGARTLSSDAEWKYVNVCRLLIYLGQSIKKGTAWTVFEPNNEATWAKVKMQVEGFLMQTWKEGYLMGTKPAEAYSFSCDKTTMTQNDIDNGKLIMVIGVAPVKPAEFVIFRIGQCAVKP